MKKLQENIFKYLLWRTFQKISNFSEELFIFWTADEIGDVTIADEIKENKVSMSQKRKNSSSDLKFQLEAAAYSKDNSNFYKQTIQCW